MAIRRILVLQSVQDHITANRIQHIESSALLQAFQFEHCFAIELNERQKLLPVTLMMWEIFQQSLDEDELYARLGRHIETFQPDLLMVFYGAILHHYAEDFMAVLARLKRKFPQLIFGITHPNVPLSKIPGASTVFDDTDEIRELARQMFPVGLWMGLNKSFSRN